MSRQGQRGNFFVLYDTQDMEDRQSGRTLLGTERASWLIHEAPRSTPRRHCRAIPHVRLPCHWSTSWLAAEQTRRPTDRGPTSRCGRGHRLQSHRGGSRVVPTRVRAFQWDRTAWESWIAVLAEGLPTHLGDRRTCSELLNEADQISRIVAKIIINTTRNGLW